MGLPNEDSSMVIEIAPEILPSKASNEEEKGKGWEEVTEQRFRTCSAGHADRQDKDDVVFKPNQRLYWAFACLAVLTLVVALDGTTLSVALPIIARALGGSALEAFWSGTSFLLASTVFQPTFAQLSHIFGRVRLLIVAITFFLVGVLIAALAKNFTSMLIGRTLQGIGGGGIIALTETIFTDLIPLRYRGQWNGVLSGMWALGSVSGPMVGGALAEVQWRWIFWLNLPFIGISCVMVPFCLRLNVVPGRLLTKLKRVDWIGSILFIASSSACLIPITWGGVIYDWDSWRTLVPLLVGVAGLVGFVMYEARVPSEPLLVRSLFQNRTINLGWLFSVLHGIILWSLLYYQPLWFEAVKGYKPVIAGVALLPATFTITPMSIIAGLIITKTGRYRWAIWGGWILSTIGLGLLTLWGVDTTIPAWCFIELVTGIGLGLLFPSLLYQIQAATKPQDVGFAAAYFSFFRVLGNAIGVGICGSIFQNAMRRNLKRTMFSARALELARDAAALVKTIHDTADSQEKLILQKAYSASLRDVDIVLCSLSGFALVLSILVKKYDINIGLETQQGLVSVVQAKPKGAESTVGDDRKNSSTLI